MNAIAVPFRAAFASPIATVFQRQPTLARYAVILLGLAAFTFALQQFDPRMLDGVNVWVKPTKFLVSVAVFALTSAWFFGYVRPERRRAPLMRGTVAVLIASASLELFWIGWQASQGLPSHFNMTTPLYGIMYGLMGLFAVLLVGTTLPLAWEIARRPAPGLAPDLVAAVTIGLLLTFLLSATLGGYMSAQMSHAVGAEGGRVPLFGWNRSGGDLRVAHFMSIHAQQAIPLLAAAIGLTGLPERSRMRWLGMGAALFTLVTIGLFAQAIAGRPLFPA